MGGGGRLERGSVGSFIQYVGSHGFYVGFSTAMGIITGAIWDLEDVDCAYIV